MRIGHISDIHWLDLSRVKTKDFLNKRLSGGLNLLSGRAKTHKQETTLAALKCLSEIPCDHVIVSGDLTNLALPAEFASVKLALNNYFSDQDLSIVPGNHDYYTLESARAHRFEEFIYHTSPGDLDLGFGRTWPFVRLKNDLAFIGLNSAQPRPWFVAAGRIGRAQCRALDAALGHPEVCDRLKIIILHHHLFRSNPKPGEALRSLEDRDVFLEICRKHKVELVCHGHNHLDALTQYGETLIAEAGSVSASLCRSQRSTGKFFVYETQGKTITKIEQYIYDCDAQVFKLNDIAPTINLLASEHDAHVLAKSI